MYRDIVKENFESSLCVCKKTISVPITVDVIIQDCCVSITGILGMLVYKFHELVVIHMSDTRNILLYSKKENSMSTALIGTTRALICGMIIGVTEGFSKKLQLIGVGYRASITNNIINLVVGLSHSINYKLPKEVQAICVNQTEIVLTSINKQLIGQVAADLRSIRPPEPFKGKGIRYMNEVIRNKDAKKR